MSFFVLYSIVLENHSVQNSPCGGGGLLAAHGLKGLHVNSSKIMCYCCDKQ